MNKNKFDFAIIGGGIIGISIGIEILKMLPKAKVAIIEKENYLGSHASGRNSGVLHAGFYYSPESLKAKFCYEGNLLMREFVSRNKLQINSVGKVVLAKSQEEFNRLTKLYEMGIANGIHLELLDQKELRNIEPLARSNFPFIWSPNTAVVDQNEIIKILQEEFLKLGGVIVSSSIVELTVNKGKILIRNQNIQADFVINSAGVYALKIARSVGAGKAFKSLPVLGTYYSVESKYLNLKTLVYPVPHSTNPFLGVHLTPSINNLIKLGPTAIPILGNEQYNIYDFSSVLSNLRIFSTLLEFGFRQRKIAFEIFKQELPYLFISNMITEMAELVPEVINVKSWNKSKPGIRAQLLKFDSLEFVNDFIIEEKYNSIHLLNIVSPGFTSAIPLATLAAKRAVSSSSL